MGMIDIDYNKLYLPHLLVSLLEKHLELAQLIGVDRQMDRPVYTYA